MLQLTFHDVNAAELLHGFPPNRLFVVGDRALAAIRSFTQCLERGLTCGGPDCTLLRGAARPPPLHLGYTERYALSDLMWSFQSEVQVNVYAQVSHAARPGRNGAVDLDRCIVHTCLSVSSNQHSHRLLLTE
ncbi:hypothetical protein RvY_02865 [Ramazzottius varieornatus]|uniref:Uncharacterized protein n=1 Tax=Ramazzottius varieornatus TaxID=947166 RepID=A0A1D1ULY6_RAMVA|nr:hypothetical protein RvY_02865 [Ramazzottius varieornatus]